MMGHIFIKDLQNEAYYKIEFYFDVTHVCIQTHFMKTLFFKTRDLVISAIVYVCVCVCLDTIKL